MTLHPRAPSRLFLLLLAAFLAVEGMNAAGPSSRHRRRSGPPPPTPPKPPPPPPPPSVCECPGAGPCAAGWKTFVSSGTCIEQDAARARVNQNCSRACGGFEVGVPWDSASTQRPAGSVATTAASSWAWAGTRGQDHGSNASGLKGALEFVTGDRTHCTMVYFEAGGGNITTGALAIQEALRWVATQRSWLSEAIPVQQALRYMWGCGPACKSSSALVDVESQLARMKYGLMDHFATLGASVQNTSWGGTAHIQTVLND